MPTQTHTPGPAETAIIEKINQIEAEIKTLEAKISRSTDNWDLQDRLQFKIEEATYYLPMLKDARQRDQEAAEADETPEEENGMITTAQAQYITDLRGNDPIPAREDAQATVEQVAELLFDHDLKQVMRTARKEAIAEGAPREDRKARSQQAGQAHVDAHPVESYTAEAQAILDHDWAQWTHAWGGDTSTLTKDEASALIDMLKTRAPATVLAGGHIHDAAGIVALRDEVEIPAEDTEAAATETPAETRFTEKATRALAKAGIPSVDPTPLAEWATAWHQAVTAAQDYPVDGVMIAEDGTVVGEVVRRDGTYYYTPQTIDQHGLSRPHAKFTGEIKKATGKRVIMVKSWEVAPGRPLLPEPLRQLENARATLTEADNLITEWLVEGRRQGIPVTRLAEAAGMKTRKPVYDRTADYGPWE